MEDLDRQIIKVFRELPADQKLQFILSIPDLLRQFKEGKQCNDQA